VQNASTIPGVARRAGNILSEMGFRVEKMENAAASISKTQVVYNKAAVATRAEKIAQLIGGGQLVKDPAPDMSGVIRGEAPPDVTLIIGQDVAENLAPRSVSR
jgi:hypothetical protein